MLLVGGTMAADSSSLDYIFQLAVEMNKLGLPWTRTGQHGAAIKPKPYQEAVAGNGDGPPAAKQARHA